MKPLKNNGIFTISTGEPDFFHQLLKVSLLPAGLASADESDVFETGGNYHANPFPWYFSLKIKIQVYTVYITVPFLPMGFHHKVFFCFQKKRSVHWFRSMEIFLWGVEPGILRNRISDGLFTVESDRASVVPCWQKCDRKKVIPKWREMNILIRNETGTNHRFLTPLKVYLRFLDSSW